LARIWWSKGLCSYHCSQCLIIKFSFIDCLVRAKILTSAFFIISTLIFFIIFLGSFGNLLKFCFLVARKKCFGLKGKTITQSGSDKFGGLKIKGLSHVINSIFVSTLANTQHNALKSLIALSLCMISGIWPLAMDLSKPASINLFSIDSILGGTLIIEPIIKVAQLL